jgi:hypothetical protein
MDLIFRHYQTKKNKINGLSTCELKVYEFDNLIHLIYDFTFIYLKFGTENQMSHHHGLTLNLKNGDISTYSQISIFHTKDKIITRTKNTRKKNNFKHIQYFTDNVVYNGEKRKDFWGVKYKRVNQKIFDIISQKILPNLNLDYHKNKNYEYKYSVNPLFDMFVDFHLSKKKIKPHNSVYGMIQTHYPKIKWLKINEHKYLPSILDSLNIKSKYLVGEINKNHEINIKSLSYLCNLFGNNYVDFLRKIKWVQIVNQNTSIKNKHHQLKNDHEKTSLITLINDWVTNPSQNENFINMLYETLDIREFLEYKGLTLKFNVTNVDDFGLLHNKWRNIKNNFKKGFIWEYSFNDDFLHYIEKDISIDSDIFNVKILKTEEDFFTEGYVMKNCMSKQFNKGVIYIYVVIINKKTRINVEYKNGNMISCYGKANSSPEIKFTPALDILNQRMFKFSNITWEKEKKILNKQNYSIYLHNK